MAEKLKLKPGLYVTATPIGNLGDISARAKDVLASVDRIACEDTRVSGKLLRHLGIQAPLMAYHEHNEVRASEKIVAGIQAGEAVALISDAGTPMISDPGYRVTAAMHEAGLPVFAVPGPSAVMAALMIAGLPTDRVCFQGFLPPKQAARQAALRELRDIPATLVFFESPKRLEKCLRDMAAVFGGGRCVAICRELTKLYEEVRRGPLDEQLEKLQKEQGVKGEIVLVVERAAQAGKGENAADDAVDDALDNAIRYALETLSVKETAVAVSFALKLPRKTVYQRALELKDISEERRE